MDAQNTSVSRGERGKWLPGKSPNPNGRPKRQDHGVVELARQHTELALKTLIEIAAGTKFAANSRVAAAQAILDRAWGRPPQAVQLTSVEDIPAALCIELVKPSGHA